MQKVQVGDFKANFSSFLKNLQHKKQGIIIEYGKKREKVAMLLPYDKRLEKQKKREFGLLKNRASFKLNNNFAIDEEEFLGYE